MDLEGGVVQRSHGVTSWKTFFRLAYQSFGVVYGDLSTSPLYVFMGTFSSSIHIHDNETEILGILSLIFWTLTLIPLLKYALIVLKAHDNGEGGTFALYSLFCRYTKLGHLPNQHDTDEEVSTYNLRSPRRNHKHTIVAFFEKYTYLQKVLLILVLLGTCMLIGDGVLTPPISVLAAVSGIKVAATNLNEHVVVLVACLILVGLFALQHYGTHKVAFMFAPIIISWLFCISSIGIYNIYRWNPSIYKGLSPYYIYRFFKVHGKDAWLSLGGVVLCITGVEAMFADLGHFSQSSIKLAFICVVYPCLVLTYMGQAAFLSRNRQEIEWNFYRSIPNSLFWPVFLVATCAAVVGSQAIISATFSIIMQCASLGCFPRVKVVHTSNNIFGQIYVREINWMLMVLCLAVTVGFRNTTLIGNAYGLAVATVMLVTTCLMTLVIIIVWRKSICLALLFLIFFGSIESIYASSCLMKVRQGGWVPLTLAVICMSIMYVWQYGIQKKYEFDLQNRASMKWLLTLGPSLGIVRVPGIGLIYTELVTGVPAIFSHFVTNIPALHQIVVFVCIKSVTVPHIPPSERFLVGRIGPKEYRIFRCVVRYGYKDVHEDTVNFEDQLIINLGEFIKADSPSLITSEVEEKMSMVRASSHPAVKMVLRDSEDIEADDSPPPSTDEFGISIVEKHCQIEPSASKSKKHVRFELPESPHIDQSVKEELKELVLAREAGIAYVMGHSYVKASSSSSLLKRFAINVVFNFMRRNCRGPSVALNVPHTCLIEVGMIYYV